MKLNKIIMAFLSVAAMGILSAGCGEQSSPDSSVEAPTIPIEPSTVLDEETTIPETTAITTEIQTTVTTETAMDITAMTTLTDDALTPEITTTTTAAEAVVDENTYIGYSDKIAFIVDSMQIGWTGLAEPTDFNLSSIYKDNSGQADFGFVRTDLDGDGIDELLIGETKDDGTNVFYDIYTVIVGKSMVSLASGGENQRYYIDMNNRIICESSTGVECYQLKDGKLMVAGGYMNDGTETYQTFALDSFDNYVNNSQQ